MKNSHKGLLILSIPFILGFALGLLIGRLSSSTSVKVDESLAVDNTEVALQENPPATAESFEGAAEDTEETAVNDDDDQTPAKEVIYYRSRLQYARLFNDMNEVHLETAKRIGLSSIPKTRDDIKTRTLRKIENGDYYVIDPLKYSVPYLTEGARHELDIIGKAFADSLQRKGLVTGYKLVISSVLRTEEDVKRLRRSGNPNASENSAHCYGTTFDITYTRYHRDNETSEFMQPFELTKVLGEVLLDEKKANHCLVKYEKKEHCFHITTLLTK